MASKRPRWKNEPKLCLWCFETMNRFQMYYCSEYCEEEARRWKAREDSLGPAQRKAKVDLDRHNADMVGDSPDDYPLEDGNAE